VELNSCPPRVVGSDPVGSFVGLLCLHFIESRQHRQRIATSDTLDESVEYFDSVGAMVGATFATDVFVLCDDSSAAKHYGWVPHCERVTTARGVRATAARGAWQCRLTPEHPRGSLQLVWTDCECSLRAQASNAEPSRWESMIGRRSSALPWRATK
jgi:hypothetical protein